MTTTLFSIDIREDLVSGVLLQLNHKSATVAGCGGAVIGPSSMEEALAEVMEKAGYQAGPCRVSFSAERFFIRNISLPFTDTKKINKILPFELEETVPIAIDRLVVDALPAQPAGRQTGVIAVMLEREFLAERLALLKNLGLDPEIVTVSGLQTAVRLLEVPDCPPNLILLDIGLQRATVIVVLNGRAVLIRPLGFGNGESGADFRFNKSSGLIEPSSPKHLPEICREFGAEVRQAIRAAELSGQDMPIYLTGPMGQQQALVKHLKEFFGVEVRVCDLLSQLPAVKIAPGVQDQWTSWTMDQALALGMRQVKSLNGLNFRKDAFAKRISFAQYRRPVVRIAAAAVVLAALAAVWFWMSYLSGRAEEKKLAAQIQTVFKETLPTVTRIVDPVKQLQAEINTLKLATENGPGSSNPKILDLLAEISKTIPASLQVRLTLLTVDSKGLRLKGETDNFNAVDIIKNKLKESKYFSSVTISSANLAPKSGEVRFELKLDLNGS
jgi:general secretion pathway protein L